MSEVINRIRDDQKLLIGILQNQEPSLSTGISELLAKSILIAGASELESALTEILVNFFEESTTGSKIVVEFVRNKALIRQYHTLFDWKENNGNKFYALFGNEFKMAMVTHLKSDANLDTYIKDFLKLGYLRNQLIHENFAAYSLSNTVEEIYSIYENAERFCEKLPNLLRTLV